MGARTPTLPLSEHRTKFDDIDETLQQLLVTIKENKAEYLQLFEASEVQTKEHKEYIERNNLEQLSKLEWAKQANETYAAFRDDIIEYKRNVKDLIERTTKSNNDHIISSVSKIDRILLKQEQNDQLHGVMREDFKLFKKQRLALEDKMVDVEKQIIRVSDTKMDKISGGERFDEMEEKLKKESVRMHKCRDNVTTLENYVERYIPMTILKTVTKVIRPLLDEKQIKQMDKNSKRFYVDLQ